MLTPEELQRLDEAFREFVVPIMEEKGSIMWDYLEKHPELKAELVKRAEENVQEREDGNEG